MGKQTTLRIVEDTVAELGLEWTRTGERSVTVTLPGSHKLSTACTFEIDRHMVTVHAFVARRPEENHDAVHRWLLERNLKLALVGFAIDRHGDIHLHGRIPTAALTPELVDTVCGIIADTADDSFNTILELGFAASIEAEWRWRLARGESTRNLAAFTQLRPDEPCGSPPGPEGGPRSDRC